MGLEISYIDGQTPLSEEEKDGLKIPSITTREELDEFEQLNIEKAIQWTCGKKIKAEELLSEKFVKDLHKRMYGDVWKWAGSFRNSEKNLGIKSFLYVQYRYIKFPWQPLEVYSISTGNH
jgi:fido (protein-threonine AMPylation protein)